MKVNEIIDKINLKQEVKAYNKYLRLNNKRKGNVKMNAVFKAADDLRRRIGFVK